MDHPLCFRKFGWEVLCQRNQTSKPNPGSRIPQILEEPEDTDSEATKMDNDLVDTELTNLEVGEVVEQVLVYGDR